MGKGKPSGRGGAKYTPPKYGGGRPSGGGKYPQDTVAVILKRETAVDLLNALIIALGVVPSPYKKGKGKKKTGGGKKYSQKKPHAGKPTGGKTYRVKPGTKAYGGKPTGGKYGRGK